MYLKVMDKILVVVFPTAKNVSKEVATVRPRSNSRRWYPNLTGEMSSQTAYTAYSCDHKFAWINSVFLFTYLINSRLNRAVR